MLRKTLEVMGNEMSADAFELFVADLMHVPINTVAAALHRCRMELRGKNGFPPRLTIADVLDRCGVVSQAAVEDAEPRAAWDLVQQYISRHVVRDAEGNYCERDFVGNRGRIPKPELPQRVRDTVRRCGGWESLVNPLVEDFPFVQRRFFDEYRAWEATEASCSQLSTQFVKQLATAKSMPRLEGKQDA